jgi:hypothetical protein
MFSKRLAAAVAVAILGVACGGSDKTAATCVPGASVACACADNSTGAQVCKPDGTFATCSCASPASTSQQDAGGGRDAGLGDPNGGAVVIGMDAAVSIADASAPDLRPGPGTPSSDAKVSPSGRGLRCDDQGNCTCLAIASIGQPAKYGVSEPAQNPFQEYLSSKSNATVKLFSGKPTLNADFLKDYDLIILQAMVTGSLSGGSTPWSFSSDEVAALESWVKAGNAIISMSGYQGDSREVAPLNQLLKFAGISYNTDDIYTTGDHWDYCRDSSVPFAGWKSPMNFGGMKAVGMFHGRSIKCSDCNVWAQDSDGTKLGVEKDVGAGRVFAWADEWVTYTPQWGLTTKDRGVDCTGHTASDLYTVPQFWYNAIANVIPDDLKKCFKIEDVVVY